MFLKSKVSSVSNTYSQKLSLVDVNEGAIRGLKAENKFLKFQKNALIIQLNDKLAQLQTLKEEQAAFNTSQKGFLELSPICNNIN